MLRNGGDRPGSPGIVATPAVGHSGLRDGHVGRPDGGEKGDTQRSKRAADVHDDSPFPLCGVTTFYDDTNALSVPGMVRARTDDATGWRTRSARRVGALFNAFKQ